jgi:hypothetical protein
MRVRSNYAIVSFAASRLLNVMGHTALGGWVKIYPRIAIQGVILPIIRYVDVATIEVVKGATR